MWKRSTVARRRTSTHSLASFLLTRIISKPQCSLPFLWYLLFLQSGAIIVSWLILTPPRHPTPFGCPNHKVEQAYTKGRQRQQPSSLFSLCLAANFPENTRFLRLFANQTLSCAISHNDAVSHLNPTAVESFPCTWIKTRARVHTPTHTRTQGPWI